MAGMPAIIKFIERLKMEFLIIGLWWLAVLVCIAGVIWAKSLID